MKRRGFLGALALSPLGAHAAVEQTKMSLAGASVTGSGMPTSYPSSVTPLKFTNFASWWSKFGEKEARQQARSTPTIDPDLVEMRLPLATKFRLQRQRNYERVRIERREHFDRAISVEGFFNWWA